MFYEVRVFDSSKKLSNRFWRVNGSVPSDYDQGYGKPEDWSPKGDIAVEAVSQDESL
jgi:hypothetical protein